MVFQLSKNNDKFYGLQKKVLDRMMFLKQFLFQRMESLHNLMHFEKLPVILCTLQNATNSSQTLTLWKDIDIQFNPKAPTVQNFVLADQK